MSDLTAFADEVERQAHLLFHEILPRCIDAWFAGRGHRLVAEMLAVHDADAVLGLLRLPPPTERARARAAGVQQFCPVTVLNQVCWQGDQLVLGQYARQSLIAPHFLQSFQVLSEENHVWLFAGSFLAAIPVERWPHEVLLTLFHEYIHAFEAQLPIEHQPLKARELGLPHHPLTIEAARRADRRFTWRRRALFFGVPALAVVLGVAITPRRLLHLRPAEDTKMAPRSAEPPRDFVAERAHLRLRLTAAVAEASTREAVIERVGHPVGDTSSPISHGVLTWARLEPRPGQPPVPDTTGRAVMCWSDPSPDVLAAEVLCVVWLEGAAVTFEAKLARGERRRRPF